MRLRSFSLRNIGSDLALLSILFMLPVGLLIVYGYYIMAIISASISIIFFMFGDASEEAYSYKKYMRKEQELSIIELKQRQLDETIKMLKKIEWKIDLLNRECNDVYKINNNLKTIKKEIHNKITKIEGDGNYA